MSRLVQGLALVLALGLLTNVSATERRVLVLGFDGLDPVLLRTFVDRGELPHFARLMRRGSFRPLATTTPPQSPVAWSTFITGMDPGGHGVYDFVHRDPDPDGNLPISPYLSTSRVEPGWSLDLGSWAIPVGSGTAELLRDGKAFWNVLDEAGVPATVVKIPANFPPEPSDARTLSDMGTPDLRGTYGTFSYFTSDPEEQDDDVSGGVIRLVDTRDGVVRAALEGPGNPFRNDGERAAANFTVFVDRASRAAKIEIGGEAWVLREGEWTPWLHVEFPFLPAISSATGIVRFHLRSVAPFRLYSTPVNLDPADPMLPISTPPDYARELEEEIGPFYTQGIPEDTAARKAGVLDDGAFLHQAEQIFRERRELFGLELGRFRRGLLYVYFGSADQLSHMYWRSLDEAGGPEHVASTHPILRSYRELDSILGKAVEAIDDDTLLLVLSDHGFAPFRREFHLNSWLRDEGFLRLHGERRRGGPLFRDVDWSETRAYALGLNALYVNLEGRESRGVVPESRRDTLLDALAERLLAYRDPATGDQVVLRVDRREEVWPTRTHHAGAPDLIVGYARGYRVSNESALGEVPEAVLEDNRDPWSGDHCIAADTVPGVILSNRRPLREAPGLVDLAPTILREFGVAVPEAMTGQPLFEVR